MPDVQVKRTWVCLCGHLLSRHSIRRVTGARDQLIGACQWNGCPCERFVAETEARRP